MTARHMNHPDLNEETSCDLSLGSWYCGLSFLESYRFGKYLRPDSNVHRSDFFFRGGWLDFIDTINSRIDRHHYDNNCKVIINEKRYKDRDFFKLNVFYNYSQQSDNRLVWPNFLEFTRRRLPTETKEIKTLIVALETMRVNGLTPKKLSKEFLGVGTVELKRQSPKALNIYSTEVAFSPTLTPVILPRNHYPDAASLKIFLTTIQISTQMSSHPRGKLFKDIIKNDIEKPLGITVQINQKLRNQFVHIHKKGTVCDLLNTFATLMDATWDWVGKMTVDFKPLEEV